MGFFFTDQGYVSGRMRNWFCDEYNMDSQPPTKRQIR